MFRNFRTCGFANALAFKNVNDEYLNEVEHSIRETKLQPEISMKPEEIYGNFYAKNPANFKFLSGEKVFIKQLVAHVKNIVDKNGENTGLSHFKPTTECAKFKNIVSQTSVNTEQVKYSYFLNKLVSTAERNTGHKKGGYRYDSDLQLFAMHLRMLSGPLAYQTLQSNLEGVLPSLPSINRYIQASHFHITEGILRTEELRIYLKERNLPNIVGLSEDGTRSVGRVQYDSRTNQMIGFTLPINQKNGMPIPFSFPARNAEEMIHHFSNGNVSGLLNVIMAQPLAKNAPAFCLLLFGTDSKYSAIDVKKRWKYIVSELEKVGISVLTFGSDSEPRYNSVMREFSKLGTKSKSKWFACGDSISLPICVQDPTHIITKLRNLLLRTKWLQKKLPFGNCSIDMMHLYVLLYAFSKDKHQLTESVLNPADRQNFASAQRMCDTRVTELLDRSVERSEGTSLYLKMMRDIMNAYMVPSLTAIQRIRCIWFPLFMLRIWRRYIENHKNYTLKDNFLSLNSYSCVELNAHSLVQLIVHLKQIDQPELFLPELFGSQQCESTFRQFRSMSSTYSTVINCTVKEAALRLSKIQLQNEIMHATSKNYVYPRLKTEFDKPQCKQNLPSIEEIHEEIKSCMNDAIVTAKKFNLIDNRSAKNIECKINPHTATSSKLKKSQEVLAPNRVNTKQLDISNIKLKDYTGNLKNLDIDETSPYVAIVQHSGVRAIIKKTSLCWLLRGDCEKVSSDRLLRVRYTPRTQRDQLRNLKQRTKKKKYKCKRRPVKQRS